MKTARLVVAGVAVLAGLAAAMIAGSGGGPAPVQVVTAPAPADPGIATSEVLVAVTTVPIGGTLSEQNMDWRRWPNDAIGPNFVRRSDTPNAREEMRGSISRFPLYSGEPINAQRIVRSNGSGFMAAMLPAGMRAVAIRVEAETGAGGFILPNDRVDVILTRRDRSGGQEQLVSDTILRNIRVMAIDQTIQERDGEKHVIGRTATLELSPRQAETISLSRQMGEMSLALRSVADADGASTPESDINRSGSVTIVRFGVPQQVPVLGR
jgi:pilus assembly protein CpaB